MRTQVWISTTLALAALGCLAPAAAGQEAEILTAPLVLDLDGDGVELIDPDRSGAFFDMDSDGFAEMTGWIAADDAFLVHDIDGNGQIDNLAEMLSKGGHWFLLDLYGELQKDRLATGFNRLRAWDANRDGVVDGADPIFAQLKLWRDIDLDGVSDPDELQSLAQAGVKSLETGSTAGVLQFGRNVVCDSGFFVRVDGSKGSLGSVRLDYNAQHTRFLGPEVEDPKTEGLPRLIGYGDAKWLSAAMSEDAELFRLVTELTKLGVGDASNLEIRVEEILLRWYRADGIASLSRGPHIDARRLTALERMQGTPWRSDNGSPNPNASDAANLNADWRNQVAYRMLRLLAQIPLGDTLIPGVEYQALAFIILPKDASPEGTLANFRRQAPGGPNAKQRYWRVMAQLLYAMYPQFKEALPKERQDKFEAEFTALIDATLAAEGVPYGYEQLRDATINRSGNPMMK